MHHILPIGYNNSDKKSDVGKIGIHVANQLCNVTSLKINLHVFSCFPQKTFRKIVVSAEIYKIKGM